MWYSKQVHNDSAIVVIYKNDYITKADNQTFNDKHCVYCIYINIPSNQGLGVLIKVYDKNGPSMSCEEIGKLL